MLTPQLRGLAVNLGQDNRMQTLVFVHRTWICRRCRLHDERTSDHSYFETRRPTLWSPVQIPEKYFQLIECKKNPNLIRKKPAQEKEHNFEVLLLLLKSYFWFWRGSRKVKTLISLCSTSLGDQTRNHKRNNIIVVYRSPTGIGIGNTL